MAEWLVEHGLGESRAALVEDGRIIEARIERGAVLGCGAVVEARLTSIGDGGRNALAEVAPGHTILLPAAPVGVTEGACFSLEIIREHLGGLEPWKNLLGRAVEAPPAPAPPLERRLDGPVRTLAFPPTGRDELEEAGWSELLEEAQQRTVRFAGGELGIYPTPAMVLIDVDGVLPADELAVSGAAAAASTIRRLGIAGSIGIDLPTVPGKAARIEAAAAIDAHLARPFERTAVNGFGFVQIVRPRQRRSLVELAAEPSFAAHALLRRGSRETGPIRLVAHPSVVEALEAMTPLCEALARQVGGAVGLRASPGLAMLGGYAEPA